MKSALEFGMYKNHLDESEFRKTKLCQITRFDPLKFLGPSVLYLSFEPTIHLGIHLKMPLGIRDLQNLQYLIE